MNTKKQLLSTVLKVVLRYKFSKKETMKTFIYVLVMGILISCGKEKKEGDVDLTNTEAKSTTEESFDVTLSKNFYMTADDVNDLYIDATVNKGTVEENTEVELVKKANPVERVSATLYRVDDSSFQSIKTAKSGQEVVLYLKIKNDKNFRFSNNADEYSIVKKGEQVTATASESSSGKAIVLVDGKPWKYDYYKIYHYTKDYGVTKSPANYLIVFTKANKNLKNAPEETLQITLFHAPKEAKNFEKADIDVSFTSDLFGEERAYAKTFKADLPATASVSKYSTTQASALISGSVSVEAKAFLCAKCPNSKIKVDFENLEAELYNN